ncbi:MAG: LysR family transcriptional regulator [Proteobacteria bacterium]|nr:LysR family transcriptional regulator [Pseudomonadota bacterium]
MWQKIPPLRCLKAFDAVVRHNSITRAASEENVSQSAISQSISQLEDMLQTRLLDRSLRPAMLTEQGKAFHRVVSEAFGRVAMETDELRAINRGTKKTITISCNLGFATYWLMPRLSAYGLLYPDITLNVMTTYQGAAELRSGVDIALRFGDGQWPDGVGDLLFQEVLIPTCSQNFLQRNGPLEGPESIVRQNLIYVDVSDPSWPDWTTYFESLGVTSPSRSKGSHFSNYVQAVQATLADEGIMLGWRSVVGDLVSNQQLVVAVDAPVKLTSGYHVLVSRQSKTKKATIDFVAWLRKIASEEAEISTGHCMRL